MGAGFLGAGFLGAGFLGAGFLGAGFLGAGFLGAGFLAAGFFGAAFFGAAFSLRPFSARPSSRRGRVSWFVGDRLRGRMSGRRRLFLRQRRFNFANELVRLFLRHLSAAYHILHEVSRTFDDKSGESGSRVDDILHRGGHLAAGLEADLMRFCRHLGDSVLDVGAAMPGAPLWRNRRRSGCAGDSGGSGDCRGRPALQELQVRVGSDVLSLSAIAGS